jgi:hypothetical protein
MLHSARMANGSVRSGRDPVRLTRSGLRKMSAEANPAPCRRREALAPVVATEPEQSTRLRFRQTF